MYMYGALAVGDDFQFENSRDWKEYLFHCIIDFVHAGWLTKNPEPCIILWKNTTGI